MHINYSFNINVTASQQPFYHPAAAGSAFDTAAEATDTDNMSQLNSNDMMGVRPVRPSHSPDSATAMDSPTMATASAAAMMLQFFSTTSSSSINTAVAAVLAFDAAAEDSL